MTTVIAAFAGADPLLDAARQARAAGFMPLDAFTPFPVDAFEGILELPPSRVRIAMAAAGVAAAAGAYLLQWWSAVLNYPIDSGGRPLHSWPVFPLMSFEVGILAAAVGGLVFLLVRCGLPRLHDPIFAVPGFERASQDRFLLAVRGDNDRRDALLALLHDSGAVAVEEAP